MYRARPRPANDSRPSAPRGSVGTARVWDERTRALRAAGIRTEMPAEPPEARTESVEPAELSSLIAGIVAVTLDTRLPDCEPARRVLLARELEARLLALFQAPAAPAPEIEGEPAIQAPAAPEDALEPAAPSTRLLLPEALALEGELEERLRDLGGALAERTDLRRRLIELVLASFVPRTGAGNDVADDVASSGELRDLDVLQRRASKLERSLADARAALAYVSGLERVEDGLASIYRAVQGLAANDPARVRKRELLAGIFHANLALQKPEPDAGAGEAG